MPLSKVEQDMALENYWVLVLRHKKASLEGRLFEKYFTKSS